MLGAQDPLTNGQQRSELVAGTPVDLRDTATGLDARNIHRLITAIRHAGGRRTG